MGNHGYFRKARRRDGRPAWPSPIAWVIIGAMAGLFAVLVARTVSKHDAILAWRQSLEEAAGRPPWPEWTPGWPPLPKVRQSRHQVSRDLHGAYAYAALHASLLEQVPCYCGCVRQGHRSTLRCFVSNFRGDGTPVWTDHSFNCPMCVHIARDVMLMSTLGLSASRIRQEIDARYADQGTPTETPRNGHATPH